MRLLPHLTAAACCAVLLAGCGGGDNATDNTDAGGESTTEPTSDTPTSDTTTSDTPTSDTTGDGGDGCAFASDADLSAAVGADVVTASATDAGCSFKMGDVSFALSSLVSALDQQTNVDATRQSCEGPITEVEAGDQAFVCDVIGKPAGFIFSGDVVYTLQVPIGDGLTTDQVVAMLPLFNT